jgi:hypothetical protein
MMIAALLAVTVVIVGPYYAAYEASRAALTSEQNQLELDDVKATAAATQSISAGNATLLKFVASVQNGPQASATRDATGWYIAELRAICAATPNCKQVPLPASLRTAHG